jgi:hypothetical protein
MKKVNLTLVFIFAAIVSGFAQTSAGTLFFGGGLGFSSSTSKLTVSGGNTTINQDGPTSSDFSIVPGVGYFVADKLAVGLDLSFSVGSEKFPDNNNPNDYTKISSNVIGINPYVRKFFMLSDNFGFTGTFGVGVGFGSSKREIRRGSTTTTTDDIKLTILEVGITPGIVFFPTNKVGLEANFGFIGFGSTTEKTKQGNTEVKETETSFGFGANSIQPTFSLGFRYYLTK